MISRTIDVILLIMNLTASIFYLTLFGLVIYQDLTLDQGEDYRPAYFFSSLLSVAYIVCTAMNIANLETVAKVRRKVIMANGKAIEVTRTSYIISISLLVPVALTYVTLDIIAMVTPCFWIVFPIPCNLPVVVLSIMSVYNVIEIVLLSRGIVNVQREKRRAIELSIFHDHPDEKMLIALSREFKRALEDFGIPVDENFNAEIIVFSILNYGYLSPIILTIFSAKLYKHWDVISPHLKDILERIRKIIQ